MRFVVCIKQVPDTAARLTVAPGALEPTLTGVVPVVNPFDEFALEEALRLRAIAGGEVVLLTLAREPVEETVFHGLAMGADRAVVLDAAGAPPAGSRATGRLLADAARALEPTLVLCGEQAVDDDGHAVGAILADTLHVPQIAGVERVDIDADGTGLRARCRRGTAVVFYASPLPAVVSCIRGPQLPRYPTLDGIFEAGAKPIDVRHVRPEPDRSAARRTALVAPAEERAGELLAGDPAGLVEPLLDRIAAHTHVLH